MENGILFQDSYLQLVADNFQMWLYYVLLLFKYT